MPKTGSTSIQMTCYENREVLLRDGIHYPDFFWNHVWAMEAAFARQPERPVIFGRDRYVGPFAPETRAEIGRNIAAAVDLHPDMSCVLSGETIVSWNHDQLDDFRRVIAPGFDRVQVVVYVRHPVVWASSMAQHLMRLHGLGLDHFLRDASPDSLGVLVPRFSDIQFAIDVFGRDNVTIRPLEAHRLVGGDLIRDFLTLIGVSPAARAELVTKRCNSGASAMEIALIDHVVEHRGGGVDKATFRAFSSLARGLPGPKFVLPREVLAVIWDASLSERRYLAEVLGSDPFPEADLPDWEKPLVFERETLARLGKILGEGVDLHVEEGQAVTGEDLDWICGRLMATASLMRDKPRRRPEVLTKKPAGGAAGPSMALGLAVS